VVKPAWFSIWMTWCELCDTDVPVSPDQHFQAHPDVAFDCSIDPALRVAYMKPSEVQP
jgi:hypothetical protein